MKQATWCAALLVLCGSVASVWANGGRPPVQPQPGVALGARNAELVVEIDDKIKDAKLQIPVGLLTAGKPRVGADAGRVPMIIAGLALTCAFVSGGFWLVRRGRGRTLAALLLGVSVLVASSAVFADIAVRPPPPKEALPPVALPANIQLSGKLVLEIVPNGTKIKLIVNKGMVLPKVEAAKE